MQVPHAERGVICPLHKQDVSKVCHKCPWWTQVRGKNPQSEEILDRWSCAVALLPLLLVENASVSRGTTVAMETLRNGMMQAVSIAADETRRRLLDGSGHFNGQ